MVFDLCGDDPKEPYINRIQNLSNCPLLSNIEYVYPFKIYNEQELLAYEVKCLEDGYEGIMVRSPDSPYKLADQHYDRDGYLN